MKRIFMILLSACMFMMFWGSPANAATSTKKIAYLTIDDGPSNYTATILNILKQKNIKATFFMINGNIKTHANAVKRLVREGHYPGLHSVSHNIKALYKTNSTNFTNEMITTQATLKKVTGFESHLIRAPFGSMYVTKQMRDYAVRRAFKMWDWTVDSRDWALSKNPRQIVQNIETQSKRKREVILIHETKQTTKMLPLIIEILQKKGYTFEVYQPSQHFSVNFSHDKRL
jgi:peptidoglycan/xylan/chitin deacetylase (PgdA/CDA1 family)